MKKPEKKKLRTDIFEAGNNIRILGYNQACDEWEKYHKWSSNIKDTVIKTAMKVNTNLKREKNELIQK